MTATETELPMTEEGDSYLSAETLRYWAEMPYWRLSEGAALLLSVDPESTALTDDESAREKLSRLIRHLRRARSKGRIPEKCLPAEFLSWCLDRTIAIPPRLAEAVHQVESITDWKEECRILRAELIKTRSVSVKNLAHPEFEPEEPDYRRLRSIYILLCVLANDYDFGRRDSAISDLMASADDIGLSIKKDAISKTLRAALELLPSSSGSNEG